MARPEQKAILEKLPAKLGLEGATTVEAVRLKLREAQGEARIAGGEMNLATRALDDAQSDLRDDVVELRPVLAADYAPAAAELTGRRADEFADRVKGLASYAAWTASHERVEQLTEKVIAVQCKEAKAQRLLKTIESIVMAANLPAAAPEDVVKRYQRLVSLEEETLAPPHESVEDQGSP